MICAVGPKRSPAQGNCHGLGSLHGSLAFTGKGHATDRAVVLGLLGFRPDTLDPDAAEALEAEVRKSGRIAPPGLGDLAFDPDRDLVFDYGPPLPGHANGLILRAYDERGNTYLTQTYYSVGGGFVVTAARQSARAEGSQRISTSVRYGARDACNGSEHRPEHCRDEARE